MADQTLRPSSAGDETNLTPVGATYNWDCVDDLTPDDDTTRVYENGGMSATWKRDLYNLQNSAADGTIVRVEVHARIKNQGYIVLKTGSTVYESDLFSYGADIWGNAVWHWNKNPETGLAWTWTQIDSLQVGVKLCGTYSSQKGGGIAHESACTQIYIIAATVVVVPTPTTQSADQIQATQARLNGTIKWTGGENTDKVGFKVWRYPTSVNDPDSGWSNEEHLLSYQNYNVFSNTAGPDYGTWLEISLDKARKIKGLAYRHGQYPEEFDKIYVEFYYNDQWNFAFEDTGLTASLPATAWEDKHTDLPEHTITKARIKIAAITGFNFGTIIGFVFFCSDDQIESNTVCGQGNTFNLTLTDLLLSKDYFFAARGHNSAGWGEDEIYPTSTLGVLLTTAAAKGASYGYIFG